MKMAAEYQFLNKTTIYYALFIISLFYISRFFYRGYINRRFYRDIPGLSHSWIWGHLRSVGDFIKDDRHFDHQSVAIWKALDRPKMYYMDTWPVTDPVVIIGDAAIAESINKATPERPYSWPKNPLDNPMKDLRAVIGPSSILSSTGEYWKGLRKRYNPGFSARHLVTLLPEVLRETDIFVDKLDRSVDSVITLGDFTTTLTVDIICAVVLGYSVGAQNGYNDLTFAFKKILDWQLEQERQDPFHHFNIFRPMVQWYYERILNRAVDKYIQDGIADQQQSDLKKSKSIVGLTFTEHTSYASYSKQFLAESRDQIKTFLFAGHDTTSSLLQWLYYELSVHPTVLSRIQSEHAALFAPTPETAHLSYSARVSHALLHTPELILSSMPFTLATIKETLRLHIIASGSKAIPPGSGLTVTSNDNRTYSLDNHVVYMPAAIYHIDTTLYGPDAEEFNPDRWMEGAEWKIPNYAFRPFERGPRACIGQELVWLEAKVILARTVCRFGFEKVMDGRYAELYNIRRITAKPNDGMRMRVFRVDEALEK